MTTAPLQLFDALPSHIEDALRASISRFGVLVPVVKDQTGRIIDGHHRSRIADQLGVKYRIDVMQVADDDEAREIARTLNSDRRHLDEEQRLAVAARMREEGRSLRQIGEALAHADGHYDKPVHPQEVQRLLERASAVTDVTAPERVIGKDGKSQPARRPTIVAAKNEREAERAQQALVTLGADVPNAAVLDVKRAERAARDKSTEEARSLADATPIDLGDVRIEHCSLSDLDLEPDSVDLMFTDPPYPAEFVPLWSDLGELAAKTLKPGGLLVAYSGQMFLPEAMSRLACHLDYWWTYAITHVGAFFQLRARHTQVGWKPVLVYRKPGGDLPPWVNDIVTDGVREKSGHDWQQSEAEAAYWIERLTERGDLVVDPFLGSGTTAAVARRLGRRFVGCDVDPLAVARTKERVA